MKKYWYVVCLLTDDCYGDFIEGRGNQKEGCPVCGDFSVALSYDNTEEAHQLAHDCGYKDGEYSIHGYYF